MPSRANSVINIVFTLLLLKNFIYIYKYNNPDTCNPFPRRLWFMYKTSRLFVMFVKEIATVKDDDASSSGVSGVAEVNPVSLLEQQQTTLERQSKDMDDDDDSRELSKCDTVEKDKVSCFSDKANKDGVSGLTSTSLANDVSEPPESVVPPASTEVVAPSESVQGIISETDPIQMSQDNSYALTPVDNHVVEFTPLPEVGHLPLEIMPACKNLGDISLLDWKALQCPLATEEGDDREEELESEYNQVIVNEEVCLVKV